MNPLPKKPQDDPHIALDQQRDSLRSAEDVSVGTYDLQQPLWGLKQKKMGPVAVAVSGGVDSAVAAMLLKQAGSALFSSFSVKKHCHLISAGPW